VERTWGDLESKGSNLYSSPQIIRVRFWVYNQPPVLENCSSDHSCQQHLQAQTCSCSGARNMDPPPQVHAIHTSHIYPVSLFLSGEDYYYYLHLFVVPELKSFDSVLSQWSATRFFLGSVKFFVFETAIDICK
jgi:hypothetical protein